MESFALDIAAFVERAKGNIDQVVRGIAIRLLSRVVERSPVGNPELWAVNAMASEYNQAVNEWNAELRADASNRTRNGRLRPGLKVTDSMDIKAPEGYVGGRFRGNWQVSFNTQPTGELDRVDPGGKATVAAGAAVVATFNAAQHQTIWLVNNLPYAGPLEHGHSTQAPAGMVGITVTEFQTLARQVASEVKP